MTTQEIFWLVLVNVTIPIIPDTDPPYFFNIQENKSYAIVGEKINFTSAVNDSTRVDRVWITHNFDLTKLHELVSHELERVKGVYLEGVQEAVITGNEKRANECRKRIKIASNLNGILQIYPEEKDSELIDNFIMGVYLAFKRLPKLSKTILVHSLKEGCRDYDSYDDGKKGEMCYSYLKKIVPDDDRIQKMLAQIEPEIEEEESHPPLERKSTGKFVL